MSQNQALRVAREFSVMFDIPRATYLARDAKASNSQFSDIFEISSDCGVPAVWCVDTEDFLQRVLSLRNMERQNTTFIVGVDKDDQTLKASVTCVTNNEYGVPRGAPVGGFKSSGVKNLLLLAATPDQETYTSVERLMDALSLPPGFKLAVDHKMKSNVCGLAGGAATHWCELCTYNKNDGDNYDEQKVQQRTFEGLHAQYEAWCAVGKQSKNQREFFNSIRPPMRFLPKEGLVSDTITLSALHLRINVVSRIVIFGFADASKFVRELMHNWVESDLYLQQFAQRDEWNGNACRKMISETALRKLKHRIDNASAAKSHRHDAHRPRHGAHKYYAALKAFSAVDRAAFGDTVADDAEEKVAAFRSAYLALKCTVSRTVHVVVRHVVPFCRKNKCGLGPFVEEAHETLHSDFK